VSATEPSKYKKGAREVVYGVKPKSAGGFRGKVGWTCGIGRCVLGGQGLPVKGMRSGLSDEAMGTKKKGGRDEITCTASARSEGYAGRRADGTHDEKSAQGAGGFRLGSGITERGVLVSEANIALPPYTDTTAIDRTNGMQLGLLCVPSQRRPGSLPSRGMLYYRLQGRRVWTCWDFKRYWCKKTFTSERRRRRQKRISAE
jgi:hypothetical protein